MQRAAFLLVCLTCTGYGRRAQPRQKRGRLSSQSKSFVDADSMSRIRAGSIPSALHVLEAVHPAAAFLPSSPEFRSLRLANQGRHLHSNRRAAGPTLLGAPSAGGSEDSGDSEDEIDQFALTDTKGLEPEEIEALEWKREREERQGKGRRLLAKAEEIGEEEEEEAQKLTPEEEEEEEEEEDEDEDEDDEDKEARAKRNLEKQREASLEEDRQLWAEWMETLKNVSLKKPPEQRPFDYPDGFHEGGKMLFRYEGGRRKTSYGVPNKKSGHRPPFHCVDDWHPSRLRSTRKQKAYQEWLEKTEYNQTLLDNYAASQKLPDINWLRFAQPGVTSGPAMDEEVWGEDDTQDVFHHEDKEELLWWDENQGFPHLAPGTEFPANKYPLPQSRDQYRLLQEEIAELQYDLALLPSERRMAKRLLRKLHQYRWTYFALVEWTGYPDNLNEQWYPWDEQHNRHIPGRNLNFSLSMNDRIGSTPREDMIYIQNKLNNLSIEEIVNAEDFPLTDEELEDIDKQWNWTAIYEYQQSFEDLLAPDDRDEMTHAFNEGLRNTVKGKIEGAMRKYLVNAIMCKIVDTHDRGRKRKINEAKLDDGNFQVEEDEFVGAAVAFVHDMRRYKKEGRGCGRFVYRRDQRGPWKATV